MNRLLTRRQFLGGTALAAVGSALGACATPIVRSTASPTADQPAPVVLRNAIVLTMEPSRPEADAVAIRGDAIEAVGAEADVLAAVGSSARMVDLGGRVLVPGFNDAHCHRIGDREIGGYESAQAAVDDALAGGWTSISELFVDEERLDELRALDSAGALRIRVNCYLPVNYEHQRFGIWFGAYLPGQAFSPRLRIGGVKLFADDAWTSRMYMTEPHVDAPDHRGTVFWTAEELTDVVRSLHDDGWQLAIHTAGDAAHDLVLDAYEAALAGADNARHRHRIEHVIALRDDQVRRMAKLAILASFQLTWFTADEAGEVETTIGRDRLTWVGRWRDLLDAGVPAVASTDNPYQDIAGYGHRIGWAMTALSVAVSRSAQPGDVVAPWRADQAISVEQGLELLTRAGAYATFEEDRKGTISPGKLADLVVLSDDPRAVAPAELRDVDVLMTMVGGRVEYQHPTLDLDAS
ncbi:MAG TPA: amidohydrolase family protein [Candidatus Limnocylindrales bacterium]|nr:amidohydrolase family protein [Candidatus Limnocylindrales bacterium]